uniref:Phosphatidylcholine:ceramide cholinephosphotransferase 2-like n=1 Tax=Saccoglossus kowalevskii TaxID=10224 RepID=A0ABM0MI16_SACKO|nr:PREDICTED: phosphatidylcholine:ceramide cholinephosphotransferase 2-like [Saccoglossus kowalevskii]
MMSTEVDMNPVLNGGTTQANGQDAKYKTVFGGRKMTLFCCHVYFAACMYLSSLCAIVANDWIPNPEIHPPLDDVLFRAIPPLESGSTIANIALVASAVINIAMIAKQKYILRFVILQRFLYTLPTMFLMRAFTMTVTSLPMPETAIPCMPKTDGTIMSRLSLAVMQSVSMGITTDKGIVCGDLIFSGHTSTFIYLSYFATKYSPSTWRSIPVVCWCLTVIGSVCLILTRGHYTVDVVLSVYLAFFTLTVHDVMVEHPHLLDRYSIMCLAFPLMYFVEAH